MRDAGTRTRFDEQLYSTMPFRLCVPIELKPQGGMYTFVGNLTRYLSAHHIEWTADIGAAYDVLFVNSFIVPYEKVLKAKRAHPAIRVVQRVDGATRDYGRTDDADENQARVNMLADRTIFQSRYSKYSATEKYKVIAQDGVIIYNPVDTEQFTPDGPRLPLPPGRARVASAAFSTNPMKGTWRIDELAAANPDVDFVLPGRFEGIQARANVHLVGHVSHAEMSVALRSCDVFLNLSENDPCPNVVTEALASGLPVLYIDSGGVAELVGDCGAAFELADFRPALDRLLADRLTLGLRARRRAEQTFAMDVIIPQYLAAMDSAVRQPVPGWTHALALAARGYPPMLLPGRRTPAQGVAALRRRIGRLVRATTAS